MLEVSGLLPDVTDVFDVGAIGIQEPDVDGWASWFHQGQQQQDLGQSGARSTPRLVSLARGWNFLSL